jgi:AraC family transcriptional activator of pobA
MPTTNNYTLVNRQNNHLAFKIFSFEDHSMFDHLQRLNYYSMLLLKEGSGTLKSDFAEYAFSSLALMCFAPYQPFLITAAEQFRGTAICFHPDFFCIHKHQKEVACNGVLFNNIYKPPFVSLDRETHDELESVAIKMKHEIPHAELAQYELLVAYLKIFLITASRLKLQQHPAAAEVVSKQKQPFVLQQLRDAIESNFRTKHAAADYAALVHLSPKALAKITKQHFNKTLTDLISERLIIEAKRELYLTGKPVKTIASELGFDDEYYFSRFFKNKAEVSPQLYRDTVGFARATA